MEILDLHTQFEELVTEMQKLRGASTLIEDTAKSSGAVVAQGEEFLSVAASLLQQARGTIAQATDELTSEAAALQGLQEEIRTALSTFEASSRDHTERVETLVERGLSEQASFQKAASDHLHEASEKLVQEFEEAGTRARERVDHVHNAVLHLTKAQRGVSAEIKSGFASAAQRRAEQTGKTREAIKSIVSEYHLEFAQSLAARIGKLEAALTEQHRMSLDGLHARGSEIHALSRKAAWATLGLAVLQTGVVVLCFWYFL